jgi:hypothetical protein
VSGCREYDRINPALTQTNTNLLLEGGAGTFGTRTNINVPLAIATRNHEFVPFVFFVRVVRVLIFLSDRRENYEETNDSRDLMRNGVLRVRPGAAPSGGGGVHDKRLYGEDTSGCGDSAGDG